MFKFGYKENVVATRKDSCKLISREFLSSEIYDVYNIHTNIIRKTWRTFFGVEKEEYEIRQFIPEYVGPYTYRESAKTQLKQVAQEAKYLMELEIIRHKNRWDDPDVI
jgi:hypothetical protein